MDIGLFTGRHEIINEAGEAVTFGLFNDIIINMDFYRLEQHAAAFLTANKDEEIINLYVTGFTPALTSFLIAYNRLTVHERPSKLVLYHYDRELGHYVPQPWFCRD